MAKINNEQELIIQRTTRVGSLESATGRSLFKAAVQTDIANLVYQCNQVLYPLFAELRSRNDVFNALENGLSGNTLYTHADSVTGDGIVYWDSVNGRPRSIKETVDVLISELARLENSIEALTDFPEYDDTVLSALIAQTDNNLQQLVKDTMGDVYTLDGDQEPDLTYSLSQHIDALGQFFDNFPGTGNTYSDTYPDINLTVNLTDINVDGELPLEAISGLDDELSAIRTFIGKNAAGAVLPNYTDYGDVYYIEDGDNLELTIQLLDKALASKPDEPLELVYKPWGSDDPANVYTDWSELMTEVQARQDDTTVTIIFDSNGSHGAYLFIPAGTYDFTNCIWRGAPISSQQNMYADDLNTIEGVRDTGALGVRTHKMPVVRINNAVNITNLWHIEDLILIDDRTTNGNHTTAIRNNIAPDTSTFNTTALNAADWIYPTDTTDPVPNIAMMIVKNSILSKRMGSGETVFNVEFITFVMNTGDVPLPVTDTHQVGMYVENSFICGVVFEQDSTAMDVIFTPSLRNSTIHHITKLEDVDIQLVPVLDYSSHILYYVDGFTDVVDSNEDTAWGSPSYVNPMFAGVIYGTKLYSGETLVRPGLVPAGDGTATKYLASDGTWTSPAGGVSTALAFVTIGHPTGLTGERSLAGTSGRISVTDGGANNDVTLDLIATAVTPGSYTAANVTVDAYGRITAATNGADPGTGPFSTTANVTSNAPGSITTDDFVFGSTALSDIGSDGDSRFWFDKSKYAFRAGYVLGTEWNDTNVGNGSAVLGGVGNIAQQNYSVVLGGQTNVVNNATSTTDSGIFVGSNNTITQATRSVILGGSTNIISNADASGDENIAIVGGASNTIGGSGSTVAGAAIIGGSSNLIGNTNSATGGFIAGSTTGEVDTDYSAIIASTGSRVSATAGYSAIIASNDGRIRDTGGQHFIGGGSGNIIESSTVGSAIVGSALSLIHSAGNVNAIVGGVANNITASGDANIILGGTGNEILGTSEYSSILGGETNVINVASTASANVIVGGEDNQILNTDGPTVSTVACVIGGGSGNIIDTHASDTAYGVVAGGRTNGIDSANASAISGGEDNFITSLDGIAPDGTVNTDEVSYGAIPGGSNNLVSTQGTGGVAMGMYAHAHTRGMVAMGGGIWAGEAAGGAQSAIVTMFGNLGVSNVDYYIYQNGEGAKTSATSSTGYGIVVPPNMSLAITWQAVGRTGSGGVPITTTARGFAVIDRDGAADPVIVEDTTATVYNGNALFTGGGGTVVPVISTNGSPDYSIIFKIKKGSNAAWNASRWVITCVCTYVAYEV